MENRIRAGLKIFRHPWQEAREAAASATAPALRQFGFTFALLVGVAFGIALPCLRRGAPSYPLVGAAVLVALLAASFPKILRPLFFGATLVAAALGPINNRVLLSLIYFLVFTPMAVLLRATGKEFLAKAPDPTLDSYRIPAAKRDWALNQDKGF